MTDPYNKNTVLVWQLLLREILVGLGKMGLKEVKQSKKMFKKAQVKVVWIRKALKHPAYLCDPSYFEE